MHTLIKKLILLHLSNEHLVYSRTVHIHDFKVESVPLHRFAALRNMLQMLEDKSSEGMEVRFLEQFRAVEVIKEVRKDSDIPIIIVSAKTGDMDKIQGLITGADDYVSKPFNPLEVMARVRSLLRRSQKQVKDDEPDVLEVGPLVINRDSHEVKTIDGKAIQLTALEFGILYLLASHPNRVFSADEIFERVWQQESIVSAKTVMVHVSHLRDKIQKATGGEDVIQTVWGVGYKVEA